MPFYGYSNLRRARLAVVFFTLGQLMMLLWVVLIPVLNINSPRTIWPLLLMAGVSAMTAGQLLYSIPRNVTVYRIWAGVVGAVFFGVLIIDYDGAASHNSVMVTLIVSLTAMVIVDGRESRQINSDHIRSVR